MAVAADLGSQLTLEALQTTDTTDVPHLSAWLDTYNGGVSAGVIHTTHVNASYPKEWGTDPYVLAPHAPASLKVDTLVDGMHYPAVVKGQGLITTIA